MSSRCVRRPGSGRPHARRSRRICAELHERFEAFCRRSLYDVNLVVLFLDAIYLPVRPSGPKEGVICAWGITENGERGAGFGVALGMRESKEDWLELGRDLIARGLPAPRLVVADGAPGLTLGGRGDLAARRPPALRRSPAPEPAGEAPEVRARPDPFQLLVSAHRRDLRSRTASSASRSSSQSSSTPATSPPLAAWQTTSTRSSCTCATRSGTANDGDQRTCSSARSGRSAGAPK